MSVIVSTIVRPLGEGHCHQSNQDKDSKQVMHDEISYSLRETRKYTFSSSKDALL
ncbi:hypothetical protein X975_01486, partial [Stegodyphus mimosarum]